MRTQNWCFFIILHFSNPALVPVLCILYIGRDSNFRQNRTQRTWKKNQINEAKKKTSINQLKLARNLRVCTVRIFGWKYKIGHWKTFTNNCFEYRPCRDQFERFTISFFDHFVFSAWTYSSRFVRYGCFRPHDWCAFAIGLPIRFSMSFSVAHSFFFAVNFSYRIPRAFFCLLAVSCVYSSYCCLVVVVFHSLLRRRINFSCVRTPRNKILMICFSFMHVANDQQANGVRQKRQTSKPVALSQ